MANPEIGKLAQEIKDCSDHVFTGGAALARQLGSAEGTLIAIATRAELNGALSANDVIELIRTIYVNKSKPTIA